MGDSKEPHSVLLIVTAFSGSQECIEAARSALEKKYSAVVHGSAYLPFEDTRYYEASMGGNLWIQLLAFEQLIAPEHLAEVKCATNALESRLADQFAGLAERPINLDPGYLTLSKFVLATTKDGAHRIYLNRGIYAEVTLQYNHGEWRDCSWTYPNYRRGEYKEFLSLCRDYYRQKRTHTHDPQPR